MITIKILGTGCSKCRLLEARTRDAIEQLGVEADVEKLEDISDIIDYGVMTTPALVINEKIVLAGRVPSLSEVAAHLANAG